MSAKGHTADSKPAKCILVLQGGGALGAYHVGAYAALAERRFYPDWVCGISIGAFNAAVIAGNAPDARVAQLDRLWQRISWPQWFAASPDPQLHWLQNSWSYVEGLWFGQPHFFSPRAINPWLAPDGAQAVSFYDTGPMAETLKRFVHFGLINEGTTKLSLGATEITSGELKFFDNFSGETEEPIDPRHVLASGALPPGFPPVKIGGNSYWDGGCVSNTPLEAVLRHPPQGHAVVFVIDLWNGQGEVPNNMKEVLWREKQIQYASRIATHIDAVATKFELARKDALLKSAAAQLSKARPGAAGRIDDASAKELAAALPDTIPIGPGAELDIVHLIYQPTADQTPWSDAEFSRGSIAARREAGYRDMLAALDSRCWRVPKPAHVAARIHCVESGEVVTREPELCRTRIPRPLRASARAGGRAERAPQSGSRKLGSLALS